MDAPDIEIIADGSLERFIPIRRKDIIEGLFNKKELSESEAKLFKDFTDLFAALYHYKFHSHLETLKDHYLPFSPDADLILTNNLNREQMRESQSALADNMRDLVEKANYEEITADGLHALMNESSAFGVEVSIDLDDFAELVLYYRGSATKVEHKRTWKSLWMKKERFETPIYKRLFLLLQFKKQDEYVKELVEKWGYTDKTKEKVEKKAQNYIKKSRQGIPADVTDDHVFLKLFKNIPRSDVATLFPNQQIRLKKWDKIRFAVTGGGGTTAGIATTTAKILGAAGTLNPFVLMGALAGLGGVIIRQVMSIFNQRTHYMMVLSKNLYFHNLSNNFGVITNLIDMAEEEESKEAVLAYYFLYKYPEKQYTMKALDEAIEKYLKDTYQTAIDFEVDDGVRKLKEEGLLTEDENGVLSVVSLEDACGNLDEKWDNFFQYFHESE